MSNTTVPPGVFACSEEHCDRTFTTKSALRVHTHRVHSNGSEFVKCDICGCKVRRYHLSRHKRTAKCMQIAQIKGVTSSGATGDENDESTASSTHRETAVSATTSPSGVSLPSGDKSDEPAPPRSVSSSHESGTSDPMGVHPRSYIRLQCLFCGYSCHGTRALSDHVLLCHRGEGGSDPTLPWWLGFRE